MKKELRTAVIKALEGIKKESAIFFFILGILAIWGLPKLWEWISR